MKKNTLVRILTLALAAVMALGAAGCKEKEPAIDPAYVAQLEQENADLKNQVDTLAKRVDEMERNAVLKDYTMTAKPRKDGTGAIIEIAAYPVAHRDGQTAEISVRLDGEEKFSQEAKWDGNAYTVSFDLDAHNGYGYYCVLVESDGTRKQAVLSNMETPVYDAYVYLETSLNAYCNLAVKNWVDDGKVLSLGEVSVQVQLPRITEGKDVTFAGAELVLKHMDKEVQRVPVELPEGEAKGSYEAFFESVEFNMPEMKDDESLELWLEAKLSDGNVLSYNGGNWYYNGGDLIMTAG